MRRCWILWSEGVAGGGCGGDGWGRLELIGQFYKDGRGLWVGNGLTREAMGAVFHEWGV